MANDIHTLPSPRSLTDLLRLRESYVGSSEEEFLEWLLHHKLSVEEMAILNEEVNRRQTEFKKSVPIFRTELAAIPSEVTRTALFRVRSKRGPRKVTSWTLRTRREDVKIEYFGIELDNELDLALWILVLGLVCGQTGISTRFQATSYGLLRDLGRSNTNQARKDLKEALDRLASATLRIHFQRGAIRYKFIAGLLKWGIEEQTGRMFIRVDPDGQALFKNLSVLDFNLHLTLEEGVTKALHLYILSHVKDLKHTQSLKNLKESFGNNSNLLNFRNALIVAMLQLREKGILSNYEIQKLNGEETVIWKLNSQYGIVERDLHSEVAELPKKSKPILLSQSL